MLYGSLNEAFLDYQEMLSLYFGKRSEILVFSHARLTQEQIFEVPVFPLGLNLFIFALMVPYHLLGP